MAYTLRVEESTDSDLARIADIIVPAFSYFEYNSLTEEDTPAGRAAAVQRHLRTKHEYKEKYSSPFGLKCVHTDTNTGKETLVTSIEFEIYDCARSEAEYRKPPYFLSANWVEDDDKRKRAKSSLQPLLDGRIKWFAGKPYGILMWTATDPAFQRLGAATKCLNRFLDLCAENGVPAMLEASVEGEPVYKKLGFEVMDHIDGGGGHILPIMIKWPEHYGDEDRKPALS